MRERLVSRQSNRWWAAVFAVGWCLSPAPARAQPVGAGPLALNDAVQLALKNYPAIKESRARAVAADEGRDSGAGSSGGGRRFPSSYRVP